MQRGDTLGRQTITDAADLRYLANGYPR